MDKNLNVAESNSTGIKCLRQHIDGYTSTRRKHPRGENNSNNEPIAPLPYLLLKNPDDDYLCYLNCILNILNKSKSIQKMFFDWTTIDDSIRYRLARIIQGHDRSATKLRKKLDKKFHTGPQDVTHVLPCLLKKLMNNFTQEEVTFCYACNEIRMADSLAECSLCNNSILTKGTLFTHHETCFAITEDQFAILRPNEHFTVKSVNYRLNTFAQYTESIKKDYGHYVAWIRRLETNENAKKKMRHNEEIQRVVNEVGYSLHRDFVCVDDDQLSKDEHLPLKDMIINCISLEKCDQI